MNSEYLSKIESPEFSAALNVVSGYKQFLRALKSAEPIVGLVSEVQLENDLADIFSRMFYLAVQETEEGHEHPNDVALAAYLWILMMICPGAACAAAQLLSDTPGCWWAKKLAEDILDQEKSTPRPATTTVTVSADAMDYYLRDSFRNVGDVDLVYIATPMSSRKRTVSKRAWCGWSNRLGFYSFNGNAKKQVKNKGSGNSRFDWKPVEALS